VQHGWIGFSSELERPDTTFSLDLGDLVFVKRYQAMEPLRRLVTTWTFNRFGALVNNVRNAPYPHQDIDLKETEARYIRITMENCRKGVVVGTSDCQYGAAIQCTLGEIAFRQC